MENNTQEKDLIERNESTIFGKIKNFFRNLFKNVINSDLLLKEY